MIERNLGNWERLLRLGIATFLIGWVVTGGSPGAPQAIALIAAFALLWNGLFARCYLWKWLGLSSCRGARGEEDRCGGSNA